MTQEKEHPKDDKTAKRRVSKGEKLFDAIVYGGMNYVGTFLITIPIAYSLQFGAARKLFNGAKNGLMNKLGWGENAASKLLETTALMQGGNVMLIPIQYCEDNKKEIIGKLNEMVGDKAGPASIEAAPKQDAWSLLKSRALAWGVVFTSFTTIFAIIPKKMESFIHWSGETAAKIFKKGETHREVPTNLADRKLPNPTSLKVLEAEKSALQVIEKEGVDLLKGINLTVEKLDTKEMKAVKNAIAKHETRAFAYGKLAAIDAFATAAAVSLLYMGTRIFGKKHEDGHKDAASIKAPTRITISQDSVLEEKAPVVKKAFAERIAQKKEHAANAEHGVAIS